MANEVYYEIEQFLERKVERGKVYYLVRWKNFPPSYDSWEPAGNLQKCRNLSRPFDKTKKFSRAASVASKLIKKSKELSVSQAEQNRSDSVNREGQSKGRKLSQVLARQRVAAQLRSKSRQLASLGTMKAQLASSKMVRVKKSFKSKNAQTHMQKEGLHMHQKTYKGKAQPKLRHPGGLSKTVKGKCKAHGLRGATTTMHNSVKKNQSNVKKKSKSGTNSDTAKHQSSKKKKRNISDDTENGAHNSGETCRHNSVILSDSVTSGSSKVKSVEKSLLKTERSYSNKKKTKATRNAGADCLEGLYVVSDSESDDDDLLYSLTEDAALGESDSVENSVVTESAQANGSVDRPSKLDSDNKLQIMTKTAGTGQKKNSHLHISKISGTKRMSLMDFKKPKVSKQKAEPFDPLLRPSSPTPFFAPLVNQSPLRGSLPSPSTLNMDSLVGDVPAYLSSPVGPISPSSISYKGLLDSLPSQLFSKSKGKKKDNSTNSVSTSSGASSSGAGNRGFDTPEPIERRISVRATECVFRYKQIVVKKCNRYTQIWLNTQTTMKNAFNPQVVQEVVAALNTAKYDDSTLVLFSSIGSFFCSGVDLHFLSSGDRHVAARQMADALRELTKAFITFPKPIIACVGGSAVGLGVALLCLCDVVYSSDKAAFHLPYAQLSQTPEGCSSFTLPLAIGLAAGMRVNDCPHCSWFNPAREDFTLVNLGLFPEVARTVFGENGASELLFGGRRITAMEAYQLGLVSHVFWPTAFMQEVIPRAQNMASCSSKVLEGTKLLIRSHHRTKMELTNETECNLLLERWSSSECQRAIEGYLANENNFCS